MTMFRQFALGNVHQSLTLKMNGFFVTMSPARKQEFPAFHNARMAKLADALASGASDRKVMGVQVPLRALTLLQPCVENQISAQGFLFGGCSAAVGYPIAGVLRFIAYAQK